MEFSANNSKCSSTLLNSQKSESFPFEDSWRVHLTVNDAKVNIPGGEVLVTHKTELYPSVTVQPAKGDELCALAIKGTQKREIYSMPDEIFS